MNTYQRFFLKYKFASLTLHHFLEAEGKFLFDINVY